MPSSKSQKNVGVIGLGIIGSRVAAGLRSAGWQTFVWNRTPRPQPNFLGSPAEVAQLCDVLQLFVADARAVFEVLDQIGPVLTPDHVVCCHGTIGLEATLEAAKLVRERGAQFLDAPFTGSRLAAEKRQLCYYVGGDKAAFLRVKPVLEASSKALVPLGKVGDAAVLKVVTNLITASSVQVLAEALALTRKYGLPGEALASAMEFNACKSGAMELKLPKMLAHDYEPHFSLKHMFKDVQLGIHLANQLGVEIPATTVTAGVMYTGMNKGWADLDFASVFRLYDEMLGISAPEPAPEPEESEKPKSGIRRVMQGGEPPKEHVAAPIDPPEGAVEVVAREPRDAKQAQAFEIGGDEAAADAAAMNKLKRIFIPGSGT